MIDTTQMRLVANSHNWRDGVASFMLDAADEIERLRDEKAELRKTLVEAAIPLEVLAGQIQMKAYRELTDYLQQTITEAVLKIRKVIAVKP